MSLPQVMRVPHVHHKALKCSSCSSSWNQNRYFVYVLYVCTDTPATCSSRRHHSLSSYLGNVPSACLLVISGARVLAGCRAVAENVLVIAGRAAPALRSVLNPEEVLALAVFRAHLSDGTSGWTTKKTQLSVQLLWGSRLLAVHS